jgi:hypothetical protein
MPFCLDVIMIKRARKIANYIANQLQTCYFFYIFILFIGAGGGSRSIDEEKNMGGSIWVGKAERKEYGNRE